MQVGKRHNTVGHFCQACAGKIMESTADFKERPEWLWYVFAEDDAILLKLCRECLVELVAAAAGDSLARIRAVVGAAKNPEFEENDGLCLNCIAAVAALTPEDRRLLRMEG